MPPKKKPNEPSKKTELKKKEKIIEDKTFGLKNKKGAKNQKFIQQVQHQVKSGNVSAKKLEQDKAKKDDKKKDADELNMIFKPVINQKIEKGADPKSVLCAFYKQGQCGKGEKCKFSHDLSIERKAEKKSVYMDLRDEDNMENWDEEKLKEVVEKKHGEAERKMPKTDIICRHFIEALEKAKYGWFWECPNGGLKCHYRHALPPGFVLNKDKKKEKKEDGTTLEDHIELQRAQLGNTLTKITLETFLAWKKRKLQEKTEREASEQDRKRAEFKAGRHVGLSGRDMFTFRPEMAQEDVTEEGESALDVRLADNDDDDDDDDNDEEECDSESPMERIKVCEITAESLSAQAREVDGTGTVADIRHWHTTNNKDGPVADVQDEASGGNDEDGIADIPIDENLFDDDDLDEIEESLNELGIE